MEVIVFLVLGFFFFPILSFAFRVIGALLRLLVQLVGMAFGALVSLVVHLYRRGRDAATQHGASAPAATESGRERPKERVANAGQQDLGGATKGERPFACDGCGTPTSHPGYCLACQVPAEA